VLVGERFDRVGDELGFEFFDPALFQRGQRFRQPGGEGLREAEPAAGRRVRDVQECGDFEMSELVTLGLLGVGGQLFQLGCLEVTDLELRPCRIPQEFPGFGEHIFHHDHNTTIAEATDNSRHATPRRNL
jgi:hypothetical protein